MEIVANFQLERRAEQKIEFMLKRLNHFNFFLLSFLFIFSAAPLKRDCVRWCEYGRQLNDCGICRGRKNVHI